MKKSIFITVALFAFTSITNQLFAQETTSKTTGKTMAMDDWQQNTSAKSSGQHIKEAKLLVCRVISTETGCSLSFEYDVKAPRDVATGQSSGKRGYDYYKSQSDFSVSAVDNSVSEVKSPRDVATGQSSGKRQHKPMTITKEYDKSSPMLAKKTSS